jgi:hypothetical protein
MVGIANTKETNDKFVEKLAAKYKGKVIDEPHMLLEMHITRETHYFYQILTSSIIEDANAISMPMDPNVIQHESI